MMRAHALVIGIDEYEHNPAWNLTGAVNDARAFAEWAVRAGGVDPANLTLLLSPAAGVPNAKRATRSAILRAFHQLEQGAAAGADRFWFYYAGHGLAPPGKNAEAGPLVVPADVEDIDFYVNKEPVYFENLRDAMQNVAPREQFYFVDACRDAIPIKDKILSQQLLWDVRGIDDANLSTQAVLLGTTAGQKAKEIRGHGLFGRALLAALRGLGPKLTEPLGPPSVNERLLFDDLVEFVKDAVKLALEELPDLGAEDRKGLPYGRTIRVKGELTVTEFPPAQLPKAKVSLLVEPPRARASGTIEFLEWRKRRGWVVCEEPAPVPPQLPEEAVFELQGGKHHVRITANGFEEEVRDLLVYEDKLYPFELRPRRLLTNANTLPVTRSRRVDLDDGLEALAFDASLPGTGALRVTCRDPKARVAIFDGGGNEVARGYGFASDSQLRPGPYRVTAELTAAERVERTAIVREGETQSVTLDVATPRSARIEAILRDHDISLKNHYAQLGEELGEVANIRLGSLLAYAAWAVRWPDRMQALHAAGVDPLPQLKTAQSALQVLVGDAAGDGRALLDDCRVEIEGSEQLELRPLPKLPAVQGSSIRESGPIRVRVEMPGFAPAAFAVTLLPSFITALVITREADGDIDVQQHFNPVSVKTRRAPRPEPDEVRLVELAWRALEGRDRLDDVELREVVEGKHGNPMLVLLAGYRMLRTARADEFRAKALGDLLQRFPGLPDAHVLAGLYEPKRRDAHFEQAMSIGTPVVADGFWALVEWVAEKSIEKGIPAPALQENVLPGLAWTAFTERARAARIGDLRVVGTSGRGSAGDAANHAVLAKAAQSVGLLEVVDGIAKASTFLVGPRLAVVPVHVAVAFATEKADGTWTMTQQNVRVRFDATDPAADRMVRRVVRTVFPDVARPDGGPLDRALLESCWPVLLELDADAAAPPLVVGADPAAGQRVAIIGFPFDYHIPDGTFAQQFAGASGEKHAMPGAVVRAPGKTWTLDYDCFTAAGTSGAPVVSVQDGTVVGMHVVGLKTAEGFKRGSAIAMTRLAGLLV